MLGGVGRPQSPPTSTANIFAIEQNADESVERDAVTVKIVTSMDIDGPKGSEGEGVIGCGKRFVPR